MYPFRGQKNGKDLEIHREREREKSRSDNTPYAYSAHTRIRIHAGEPRACNVRPRTGHNGYTTHTLFSFLSRRQAPMKKKREKERVASQKRTMPIIGNGRPHLATFALLDVDTGLTDRPVNHRRFNRGVLSCSHMPPIFIIR